MHAVSHVSPSLFLRHCAISVVCMCLCVCLYGVLLWGGIWGLQLHGTVDRLMQTQKFKDSPNKKKASVCQHLV